MLDSVGREETVGVARNARCWIREEEDKQKVKELVERETKKSVRKRTQRTFKNYPLTTVLV